MSKGRIAQKLKETFKLETNRLYTILSHHTMNDRRVRCSRFKYQQVRNAIFQINNLKIRRYQYIINVDLHALIFKNSRDKQHMKYLSGDYFSASVTWRKFNRNPRGRIYSLNGHQYTDVPRANNDRKATKSSMSRGCEGVSTVTAGRSTDTNLISGSS